MKASLKFREDKGPLLRVKIPFNTSDYPHQYGFTLGDSNEPSFVHLSTNFNSGPSIKLQSHFNDQFNLYSLVVKTGLGPLGSPNMSSLVMSAKFTPNTGPTFGMHFKPRFGDFTLRNLRSSNFGLESVAGTATVFDMIRGLCPRSDVTATTSVPVMDIAMLRLRWGLRLPSEMNGNLPLHLGLDKISIEQVYKSKLIQSKMCSSSVVVKEQFAFVHAKNELLRKSVENLQSVEEQMQSVQALKNSLEELGPVKEQMELVQAENESLKKSIEDLRSDFSVTTPSGKYNGQQIQKKLSELFRENARG